MRERIHGRISNKSDNAFKLRKFAKMYDTSHSGLVSMLDALLCIRSSNSTKGTSPSNSQNHKSQCGVFNEFSMIKMIQDCSTVN